MQEIQENGSSNSGGAGVANNQKYFYGESNNDFYSIEEGNENVNPHPVHHQRIYS